MGDADADVDLGLKGRLVSRCCVDTAFILEVLENDTRAAIRIGGQMDLEDGGVRLRLSGERPLEARQACILVGKTIGHAIARKDGSLEVAFTDGSKLDVPADPHYEAWEASADDGLLVISLPGGGLSVWSGRGGHSQTRSE